MVLVLAVGRCVPEVVVVVVVVVVVAVVVVVELEQKAL